MNRRSFLSALALIPGLGWVKRAVPAEAYGPVSIDDIVLGLPPLSDPPWPILYGDLREMTWHHVGPMLVGDEAIVGPSFDSAGRRYNVIVNGENRGPQAVCKAGEVIELKIADEHDR